MVAAAFPLAQIALDAGERKADEAAAREANRGVNPLEPGLPPLPFTDAGAPPSSTPPGDVDPFGSLGGPSSRPGAGDASQDRASASGSVLVQQVLGAAQLMGHTVEIPPLPIDKIPAENPLRAAIVAWIAATGATVPPEELAVELARADAVPIALQRDLALVLFSAADATLLQRAALAPLAPSDLAWVYANPQIGEELALGIDNDDTRRLAVLGGLVDVPKSIAASLLLLQAIDATRGAWPEHEAAIARDALDTAVLDDATRELLALLLAARSRVTDSDKVLLAAELIARGSDLDVPASQAAPSFAGALASLLATTDLSPAPAEVSAVLARADLLPPDLQAALARLIQAEANAIRAADPVHLTPTSQHEALLAMLVATADALPTLSKYNLYWRDVPDALRVSEWEPGARVGWAAHHAALLVTTHGVAPDVVRAAAVIRGEDLPELPSVPEMTFTEAYLVIAREGGYAVDRDTRVAVEAAAAELAPAVRDAATVLLSGAAESARLQRVAFSALTPEEASFLRFHTDGLDDLYAAESMTTADLDRLARASALADKVDAEALTASGIVASLATMEARRILEGAGSFQAQGNARHVATGLPGLFAKLAPWRQAQAQGGCEIASGIVDRCGTDVLLRLHYPVFARGYTPAEAIAASNMSGGSGGGSGSDDQIDIRLGVVSASTDLTAYTCNEAECVIYGYPGDETDPATGGEASTELLVITGFESTSHTPGRALRRVCPAITENGVIRPDIQATCRTETVHRYGAPTITLDLGGSDTYAAPIAMVHNNATIPVSLHLDMGGNDAYSDPTTFYDVYSPLLRQLGDTRGHPTQGSAMFGGVAILVDAGGNDVYTAPTRSMGFGRLGLGMLVDLAGNDNYEARALSMGVATDSFTLGAGILLDTGGNDNYLTSPGHGYGLGGVFLDANGADRYVNHHDPIGIPGAKLDILPGGDITNVNERGNARVWLDGPGSVNVGIGLDVEIIVGGEPGDSDGYPDLVEFAVGTDPYDNADSPATNPTARATALLEDNDRDGFPAYIERALSTDPDDAASYPLGLPSGPSIILPAPIADAIRNQGLANQVGLGPDGSLDPFAPANDATSNNAKPRGSDKILDLRVPLRDAGSIEWLCTGPSYTNATAPAGFRPGENILMRSGNEGITGFRNPSDNGPVTDSKTGEAESDCVYVSYQSNGPGDANATTPSQGGTSTRTRDEYTISSPAGILAIGDVISTHYADDYLVVVDLGGSDTFSGSAGGALVVKMRPRPQDNGRETGTPRTAVVPSLVVNVDPSQRTDTIKDTGSNDVYSNATRDYAHGAFFGVLVDTGGHDRYVARDGSQGAFGGVLLDLEGHDNYTARHLSQGVALASVPAKPRADLADGATNMPSDDAGSAAAVVGVRRGMPGVLLDLGDRSGPIPQRFVAGAHSQGFSRGYVHTAATSNSTRSMGILAVIGTGSDHYTADRNSQGVAGFDALALLLDTGGADTYAGRGPVTQGATISQTVNTEDSSLSREPRPAIGALVDLGGRDTYPTRPADRRNQNTDIVRSETAQNTQALTLYTDVGLHVDTETDATIFDGLGGSPDAIDPTGDGAFYVHLPTARLAIGRAVDTVYTREYAFVVDMGGRNTYSYSAGGFIRDQLAGYAPQQGTSATDRHIIASLFPVTFLLEAGQGDSTYTSTDPMSQGAGYFSVGIAADMGGVDKFRQVRPPVPALGSAWIASPPTIDGSIGLDWEDVPVQPVELRSIRDARQSHHWTARVGNDGRALYLGLEGTTFSRGEDGPAADKLTINLEMGRRNEVWNTTFDRTGIDRVVLSFERAGAGWKCRVDDRHARVGPQGADWQPDDLTVSEEVPRLEAACRFTSDGRIFFEMRKDLVERFPRDRGDLGYCYDENVGFGLATNGVPSCIYPLDVLGLFLQFDDSGAGVSSTPAVPAAFTWPPGSVTVDGAGGNRRNGDLRDEMEAWGVIGLAARGVNAPQPNISSRAILSDGAAVVGVGILALLGQGRASADIVAGDRAIGYGTFGGIGAVIDLGGSDRYQGGRNVLGAGDTRGAGVFFDLEGHDNYITIDESIGWAPTAAETAGLGAFLDLGGDDDYTGTHIASTIDAARDIAFGEQSGENVPVHPPEGNNILWTQGAGFGADFRATSLVREAVSGLVDVLYGSTATQLLFTVHDPNEPGPFKNGCTYTAVPTDDGTATGRPLVTGTVCLMAAVDTGKGPANLSRALGPLLEIPAVKSAIAPALASYEDAKIDVEYVDFLIGRARIATAATGLRINTAQSVWTVPFNSTEITDGVKRVKAQPAFTAEVAGYGTLAFVDRSTTNDITDDNKRRTAYVNNVPEIDLELLPAYTGIANSTFSRVAYGAAQALSVRYDVSHDAGQDRLEAANGLFVPRNGTFLNKSFPCVGFPGANEPTPRLCDELPFFIPRSGEKLRTTPGQAFQNSPGNAKHEMLYGAGYSFNTDYLRTPLHISMDHSFHLALPGRTSLVPLLDYVTWVEVTLKEGDNVVKTAEGDTWRLGYTRLTAGPQVPTAQSAAALFGLTEDVDAAIQEAVEDVQEISDSVFSDNPVRGVTDRVYFESCIDRKPVPNQNTVCDQVNGTPGTASFTGCTAAPADGIPTRTWWDLFNTPDILLYDGDVPRPSVVDQKVFDPARSVINDNIPARTPVWDGTRDWETPVEELPILGGIRGLRVCEGVFRYVNQSADLTGPQVAAITNLVGEQATGAIDTAVGIVNGLGPLDFGSAPERKNGLNFTDLFFNVTDDSRPDDRWWGANKLRIEGDTFVIPAGYRIELRFGVEGAAQLLSDPPGEHLRPLLHRAHEEYRAQIDANPPPSTGNSDADFLVGGGHGTADTNVNNLLAGAKNTYPDSVNSVTNGAGIPASIFFAEAGAPDQQARLSIRIPSEPTTDVRVTLETPSGDEVAEIQPALRRAGDVPGTPTRDGGVYDPEWWITNGTEPQVNWTAGPGRRWTQHAIPFDGEGVPDGLYKVAVTATDAVGTTTARETVLIDTTPPLTLVTTDLFAGEAVLVGGRLPLRWSTFEQGSGVEVVRVYVRDNASGDINDPETWYHRTYPATVRSDLANAPKDATNTYFVLTVGVDRAGNVEGTANEPDLETAFENAFKAKLARGDAADGYRRITIDRGDPRFTDFAIEGGRLLTHNGGEFTFIRAGRQVNLTICTRDAETDIARVVLSLDHIDTQNPSNASVTFLAERTTPCANNGVRFVASTWHTVNTNRTLYPGGVWAAMFEVHDKAGNKIRVPLGNLILDHDSPTVNVEAPILPAGQTAVKPDDLVKIRLLATDAYGVDEGGIRVDASQLARNASALATRPVRVNGIVYQETSFKVDRPDIDNRVYNVLVHVPDLAGNVTTIAVPVPVNFRAFSIVPGSLSVTNVTHNGATLVFRTDEPTAAFARYGSSPVALTGRSAQTENLTTQHAVRIEGLSPSTHYHVRGVAVSAGGLLKETDILEIDTTTALYLDPVSPKTGDAVSGLVKVDFRGGLLDSTDFVSYTLEVRESGERAWTFVTTATRQGERHELNWNSSRFLDGTAYELRLTAKAGRDVATRVIGPITADNTPPSVLILGPLLATNDTTPTVRAEAADILSGLSTSASVLLVDGTPINTTVTRTPLTDGRVSIVHEVPTPLTMGMRTFELRVLDKAGNTARAQWRVAVDGEAPNVTVNPTRYAPGFGAAKQGGTVTLNLTILDLSGVASAIADTSALSTSKPETTLVKLVNTDEWQGTFSVTATDADAEKTVTIVATDHAGNIRRLAVKVPLDNTPPNVPAARFAEEITHTRAVIEVPANEPIVVNGTATAPLSPADSAATREPATSPRLEFKGLLPSRTYSYRITAADRGGNAVELAGTFDTRKDTERPSGVGQLSVVDLLNGTLRFTWAPATDDVAVDKYRIYRSEDGVTFTLLAQTTATTYEDAGLPYEKIHVYKVAALDYGGNEGPSDNALRVSATSVPTLAVGVVTPTVGSTSTTFRYSVTYTSPGGREASYVRVILDGVPQNMTLASGEPGTGAIYVYETRLAPHKRDAPHTYAFEASDGRYTVRSPADGSVVRGPLVSADALEGSNVGGFASFAQRVPLGGLASMGMAVIAAAAIAAYLGRRRKEGSK